MSSPSDLLAGSKTLQKKIFFTLGLLIVYRVGCHITIPGVDIVALSAFFSTVEGTLLGLFDMFAGGALSRLTVFALGIMPYISASIIFQLMSVAVPYFEQLKKEGDAGRQKITQYTRYGTLVIAVIQGFGMAYGLERMTAPNGVGVVIDPGMEFKLMTVTTLVCGTIFMMWLGEKITERGIGNGISLIIFAGIIANLPGAVMSSLRMVQAGDLSAVFVILLFVMGLLVIGFVVFMEKTQRRITIQYAKRVVGNALYGGQTSHLPLKVNTAGVIPPIFASSLILFPATIASFVPFEWMQQLAAELSPGQPLYLAFYVSLIVFFCYFYTAIVFNPQDTADNLKKSGAFVPGIRPGKRTAEYIDSILTRITLVGAVYVAFVCVIPEVLIAKYSVPFYFGGTSLLIVVAVALDLATQIQNHMMSQRYDGIFDQKGKRRHRGKGRGV